MTAEAIANVVRDIRLGRVLYDDDRYATKALSQDAMVIDSTAVYQRYIAEDKARNVYEDHRVCPPWENALVSYVNKFGNVEMMSVIAVREADWTERWDTLADTHHIDWERVEWILFVVMYVGGRSNMPPAKVIPTQGPMHCWRIAVYPDGEIADVNWLHVREDLPVEMWDTAMMVLLDTYNMCNCTNVEVAVPTRSRHEARRVSRMGVTVSEIHVKPVSRSYRGKGTPLSQIPLDGPLSSVRGHFASYGPKYGRGLLFGKIEGRFWISQHVRGVEEVGVTEHEYTMKP